MQLLIGHGQVPTIMPEASSSLLTKMRQKILDRVLAGQLVQQEKWRYLKEILNNSPVFC